MRLENGWTGGQYSLFRILVGSYLFVHFIALVPWGAEIFSNRGALPKASDSPLIFFFPNILAVWDAPLLVTALLVAGAGLSVLFAAGKFDRVAAVALWYILASLFGRDPLITNPSLPYVGWLLLAHAFIPAAPYGSWAARGRPDPGHEWKMPGPIYAAAWVLLALSYSYSGYEKLVSPSWVDGSAFGYVLRSPLARNIALRVWLLELPAPFLKLATWGGLSLELLFAPLALIRRLRPWIWTLMLAMHFSLMGLVSFAELSLGMVLIHLFTFSPAWVAPRAAGPTETLFYDGHCGLCHRFVRFVLAEDRSGAAFQFAPLASQHFRATVPEAVRNQLPDSLVVGTAEGRVLTRSRAVIHVLDRMGGMWRLIGLAACLIPSAFRDFAYDAVARVRYRLFARPQDTCPILPPSLRTRFRV
jgi:predicted DCC family thiol-disulfide oxidoreductase YuxK